MDYLFFIIGIIGELPVLTADFQLNIYRILQEIINNILKHSGASYALIQFHVEEELYITIDDNGSTELSTTDHFNKGIGLQNLQDRVKILEGVFSIEKSQNNGTSIYMEFPLKKFAI